MRHVVVCSTVLLCRHDISNIVVTKCHWPSIVLHNGLNKVFVMALLITALYQIPNIKGYMSVYPYMLYISFTAVSRRYIHLRLPIKDILKLSLYVYMTYTLEYNYILYSGVLLLCSTCMCILYTPQLYITSVHVMYCDMAVIPCSWWNSLFTQLSALYASTCKHVWLN